MNQNETRFRAAICGLWSTLNAKAGPMPPETQRGYVMALADLPIESIEKAAALALRRCKFFPAPVELRMLAGVSPAKLVEDAWLQLLDAVDCYSTADQVVIGCPALAATIRALGGLSLLANTTSRNLHAFTRKQFEKTFDAIKGTEGPPVKFVTRRGKLNSDRNNWNMDYKPTVKAIGCEGLDVSKLEDRTGGSVIAGDVVNKLIENRG